MNAEIVKIHIHQGNFEQAIAMCREAIASDAAAAEPYKLLGDILAAQGKIPESERAYRKSIAIDPTFAAAFNNLGNLAAQQQQWQKAEELYQQAIQLNDRLHVPYWLLGNVCVQLGKLDLAAIHFQSALELNPNFAEVYNDLGAVRLKQFRPDEAVVYLKRALALNPDRAECYNNLASALVQLWKLDEARQCYETVLRLQPDDPQSYLNIGRLLSQQNLFEDATQYFRAALRLKPDFGDAFLALGNALKRRGHFQMRREAANLYVRQCGEGDRCRAQTEWIAAHLSSGLYEGVREQFLDLEMQVLREAENLHPKELEYLYTNLLYYVPHLRDDVRRNARLSNVISRLYAEKVLRLLETSLSGNDRAEPNQPLKIGFLSNHFCRHSVRWCCMDTIVELSHHTPHLFLYVTDTMERDEQTDLFEQAVEKIYFPKNPGNASEIARAIQQDGIDILIDLDSLTTPNNVRILYQRPAAICISWMGFDAPFISSDGYLLGDAHTRPPGIETHYVEKILRMPDALVAVSGFDCEPISREERREALGIETHEFAYLSVARGTKFTAEMVRAQIAILQQVPDSVLIYKQVGEVAVIDEAYRRECEIQQVDFRRLRGVGVETPEERHRTIYRAADLLLDSYPMNGGTYSLEALWLELPMVTLVGEQYCSRMGYSFLKTLGIEVGLAGSWEEYVGWGIRLGRDTALRQSIRERLLAAKSPESLSPLWNPNKFARDLYYILQELLAQ